MKRIGYSAIVFFILLVLGCESSDKTAYQGYVEGEALYIASPYSGILERLFVHRGQAVQKNDQLFALDDEPQRLIIKQYKADLSEARRILTDLQKPKRAPEIEAIKAQIEQTESLLDLARIRVHRYQTLYSKNAVDKDSLDEAIARAQELENRKEELTANLNLALQGSREEQIDAQKAQVEALMAKWQQAKWELEQKTLFAPTSGIIFDTYYRQGEFVAAQQPVMSLLPPENIRIEFFVPLEDMTRFRLGQNISFTCGGCNPVNHATVSYISPEAEYIPPLVYSRENDDKLVFRVKAQIKDSTRFKPGQPVTIIGREHEY